MIQDEGEGPAVVLLPRAGTVETWRELAPLLLARFRVIEPANGTDVRELLDERSVERFAAIGERDGADAALALALDGAGVDALVLLTPSRVDRPDELSGMEIPVLIFCGEDHPDARVAERLCEAIPTSTVGVLPGVGGDLTEEAPATIFPMVYEYLRARYLHAPHGHGAGGVVTIQLERKPPWIEGTDDESD